jgi:hypothetical protein
MFSSFSMTGPFGISRFILNRRDPHYALLDLYYLSCVLWWLLVFFFQASAVEGRDILLLEEDRSESINSK